MPTIAVEFTPKLVTLNDKKAPIKTQISDTAGQETFWSLTVRLTSEHSATIDAWMEPSSFMM